MALNTNQPQHYQHIQLNSAWPFCSKTSIDKKNLQPLQMSRIFPKHLQTLTALFSDTAEIYEEEIKVDWFCIQMESGRWRTATGQKGQT